MMGSERQEFNEELYNFAPCGFFTATPDGTIIQANDTFLNLLGWEREEILGKKHWQDFLTMGGNMYHETHYKPLLQLQGHVKEINLDFKKKDGSKVPVLINTFQEKNDLGQEFHYSSVLDITQRKQYERELLLAKERAENLVKKLRGVNSRLKNFASMVSHDLQAPLTAIKGYTQVLRMTNEKTLDVRSKQLMERVEQSTNAMSKLIQDLLEFSRLEEKAENFEPVNLNEVWEEVLQIFEEPIRDENAKVQASELPVVRGNKSQLARLFQNLLSNSLKYRSEKSLEITLGVTQENGKWNFTFKDNGIGFDQSQANAIFGFFQRLHTKGNVSGSGIGLAATKKIVELHGGQIKAVSDPGKGATFIFNLPSI